MPAEGALLQATAHPPGMVTGVQWVGDLAGCICTHDLLESAAALQALCEQAVRQSGLKALSAHFHQFEPAGATGVVVLAESHLAVHTWPEKQFVTFDLYVCNHSVDNRHKAEALVQQLLDAFAPAAPSLCQIERGAVATQLPRVRNG